MKWIILISSLSICACEPKPAAQRTKTVINLADYQDALDECRKLGNQKNSFDIYEQCAKEADKKYGKKTIKDYFI